MPDPVPPPPAAQVLQAILPKKVLIGLALFSFALAIVLFLMGAFLPNQFAMPGPRFCLFGATALALAVFLFLIFPERFEPTKIPALDVAIKLGGPPALFFFTVIFLNHYYPKTYPRERHVRFEFGDKPVPPLSQIAFNGSDDKARLRPILDPDKGVVTGVLVTFLDNRPYKLSVSSVGNTFPAKTETIEPGYEPQTLTISP